MFDKLSTVESRYDELMHRLGTSEVQSDPAEYRKAAKALSDMEPLVQKYREYKTVVQDIAGSEELVRGSDAELRALAEEDLKTLAVRKDALLEEIKILLIPKDPNDEKNVIMEIRAGTGGEEAALFAAELFRMYVRYSERHRWQTELLSANETGIGGLREVIFAVHGDGAYSRLKYEGGVHRVQRVPETESSGRLHTSTATVAVLPEADEVEIQIDDKDLKIDVYRSQGPGGQSVNTTDSAVRITHIPTGMVVAIQDEKSQHKNKAKALSVLRARLLELEQRKAHEAEAEARRTMVGSGERSEKIRTYNFPQDRVTDHRIGVDLHNLPNVLDGDLDRLLDELIAIDQAQRLSDLERVPTTSGAGG